MMKVPISIRTLYNELEDSFKCLSSKVNDRINNFKEKGWHYESRIKDLESFALKLETGRCTNPEEMEDFFGCMLVVENLNSVFKAERIINNLFDVCGRRPDRENYTSKPSDSFRFDDLRLYVKWKDDKDTKPSGIEGMLFEVQIKTFLQHAWSIATHDLIYKSDKKEWAKERIAFQVKAMLEHAEISIQEAELLSKSSSLKKTDKISDNLTNIVSFLNEVWQATTLPKDRTRLAENINTLISVIDVNLDELRDVINAETVQGRGTHILSLSPYAIIIQSLFNQKPNKLIGYLTSPKTTKKFKVYLHKELELPSTMDVSQLRNAVLYPPQANSLA